MRRVRFAPSRARGALVRALLVGVAGLAPALILSGGMGPSAVIALVAALMIFAEYAASTPAFIDFRFAPPVNRLRFGVACGVLFAVTLAVAVSDGGGGAFGDAVRPLLRAAGQALDFRYSPARMAADAFTRASAFGPDPEVQAATAMGLIVAVLGALGGGVWIASGAWPRDAAQFNALTNLPTFEPANSPDSADRLARLGRQVCLTALALLLALLVLARLAAGLLDPLMFQSPLALTWAAAIWAGAPATLALRGVALLRLARLLREGRLGGRGAD